MSLEAFPRPEQYRDDIAAIAAQVQRHREIEAMLRELVETSSDVRSYCIPGMNWTDEVGELLLARLDAVLARAEELLS